MSPASIPPSATAAQRNPAALSLTPRSAASFTLYACALFIVLGVVTTLLGPTLPLLAVRWSLSTVQQASLFFWQFVPSTIGTLLSGALLARRSFRFAVVLGVSLCLLGVAALIWSNWNLGRLAIACYGVGLGIALPVLNLAVAEANRTRRAASVSLLNFSWGIGAICGPVLLRLAHSLELFFTLLSTFVALGLLASLFWEMPGRDTCAEAAVANAEAARAAIAKSAMRGRRTPFLSAELPLA